MARNSLRKKSEKNPLWLISYADLVTLMLCFMVLLVSLSVIDERQKQQVLGSVNKSYSISMALKLPDEPNILDFTKSSEGSGYASPEGFDFNILKKWVQQDQAGFVNFQENRFVQILSLSEALLFLDDSTELSPDGILSLDRILPLLIKIQHPLLIAGHTAPVRDEAESIKGMGKSFLDDPTWFLSFKRARAVYDHLLGRGIEEDKLSLEAFGQHRPRFSMLSPEGRQRNRRVDLVLDKRNKGLAESISKARILEEKVEESHDYKGFKFDLLMPGESRQESPAQPGILDEELKGLGPIKDDGKASPQKGERWESIGTEGLLP